MTEEKSMELDMSNKITIEITPLDGTCRDCNLLIFDDMGGRPYCAAGHKLMDTLTGYPARPATCYEAEIQDGAELKAMGVPTEFIERGKEYKPVVDALQFISPPTKYCTVDHRYANSQIRYRLLQWLVTQIMTLEEISTKSGLSVQHLTSVCLGKSDVTYADMAKLAKALFGPNTQLLVTLLWQDCGFSISEENACPEDQECVKLLEQGQREGTVPTKVW